MRSPRKPAAHIGVLVRRSASGRQLGGFLPRGIFLAALPLAAAWLLMAPARTMAQQDLYMAIGGGSTVYQFAPTANAAAPWTESTYSSSSTNFEGIYGMAFDSVGNLYVSSNSDGALGYVAAGQAPANGVCANMGGEPIDYVYGMVCDSSGNVYIANQEGQDGMTGVATVSKYTVVGNSPTNSSNSLTGKYTGYISYPGIISNSSGYQNFFPLTMDSSGNLWVGVTWTPTPAGAAPVAGYGGVLEYSIPATGSPTLMNSYIGTIDSANGIAFDSAGNLYAADYLAGTIWKYTSGNFGSPTPLITGLDGPATIEITAGGDLIEGNNGDGTINEYSLSGTPIDTIATGYTGVLSLALSPVTTPAWTGGSSDNMWMVGDTGNWSTGVVPGNNTGSSTLGYYDTDTALFNQNDGSSDPTMIQANLNIMNITFDNSGGLLTTTITIGTTTGNPLLLTDGGTIQITSSVANAQVINAPLVLEGTLGALTNSYNLVNNSTTATLTVAGGITSGASNSVTTLNLSGMNTSANANTISGSITDGSSGAAIAVAVQSGYWTYTAANSYSGGTTIFSGATLELANSTGSAMTSSMNIVNSGSLLVAAPKQIVGTITGSGSVTVNSGSLTAYQIVQNSLTIGSGATVTLAPSGSGSTTNPTGPNNINFSSTLTSLSIAGTMNAWTGTLDIGNNGLVIEYGTAANDPYATINNMIETGFDAAHWDGQGITSSLGRAAANSHTPLNIGLTDFTPGLHNDATFIVFAGQTITTNAILIRLTYMDDIILAGDMNSQDAASDALIFAANYGSGTTWNLGDLDHTGLVGAADALLFAANYQTGLASLDGSTGGSVALGGTAAVPEPACMALLALGALGLLVLRRHPRTG